MQTTDWTEQENWVYEQIKDGKSADLHDRSSLTSVNGAAKPKDLPDHHLRREFIEFLLINSSENKGYSNPIAIANAYLVGEINLQNFNLNSEIRLKNCQFSSSIIMARLKTSFTILLANCELDVVDLDSMASTGSLFINHCKLESLILTGGYVKGQLNLNSSYINSIEMSMVHVDNALLMNYGEYKNINLRGAHIEKNLELIGAKCKESTDLTSMEIGLNLVIRCGKEKPEYTVKPTELEDLLLTESRINSTLILGGNVKNLLNMDSIKVGYNLYISPNKYPNDTFGNQNIDTIFQTINLSEVSMLGAHVEGVLEIEDTIISDSMCIDNTEIYDDLFIRSSNFEKIRLQLTYSTIKKSLIINSSILNTLELSGTVIGNYLDLGHSNKTDWQRPPEWIKDNIWRSDKPRLILTNTVTRSIQDTRNSWPRNILLDGFDYSYFGSYGENQEESFVDRELDWYKKFLGEDYVSCKNLEHLFPMIKRKHWKYKYSGQPYIQLSKVLRKAGYEYQSDEILYSAKDRLKEQTNITFYKLILYLQCYLVGYGYRYWYSFIWVIALILLGTIIFSCIEFPQNSIAYDYNLMDALIFSIDKLVPVLELDEQFSRINLYGPIKYYFYFQKIMGYILVIFITAALTGITKRLDE